MASDSRSYGHEKREAEENPFFKDLPEVDSDPEFLCDFFQNVTISASEEKKEAHRSLDDVPMKDSDLFNDHEMSPKAPFTLSSNTCFSARPPSMKDQGEKRTRHTHPSWRSEDKPGSCFDQGSLGSDAMDSAEEDSTEEETTNVLEMFAPRTSHLERYEHFLTKQPKRVRFASCQDPRTSDKDLSDFVDLNPTTHEYKIHDYGVFGPAMTDEEALLAVQKTLEEEQKRVTEDQESSCMQKSHDDFFKGYKG